MLNNLRAVLFFAILGFMNLLILQNLDADMSAPVFFAALAGILSLAVMSWFSPLRWVWGITLTLTALFLVSQRLLLAVLAEVMGGLQPLTIIFAVALSALPFALILSGVWLVGDMTPRLWRLERALRIVLIASALLLANIALLTYFNTLVWPYFWPNSALLILAVGFVLVAWFPEFGFSIWMLRIIGLLLIFIGQSYALHSLQIALAEPSPLTIAHWIGGSGMLLVLIVNYVNQIRPKNNTVPPPLPDTLPVVAVVVPTYGEPYDVLEKTIASIRRIDYPSDRLCLAVSDDGRRPEIRRLASKHGVHYIEGPQKDAKAGNLNHALAYFESVCPEATLILTQDADEVVHPSILKKLVGYFADPLIAFVQTPKEVLAPPSDPFGTRDRMFYDIFQVGRNGYGAAFACGSGVVWRIDAVKSIGGFATWNVVEDLTTSYQLHSAGYRSEYHNERLSVGLAPEDIPGLLKQRGTWAVDTWRLFLFDNPLFKRGLNFGQRLQYFELGLFYIMSSFFMPVLMLLPVISLLTGEFIPIQGSALFPWLTINFLYYVVLSRGRSLYMLRMWQYWIGHWPTYFKAFWIAVGSRGKKPRYVVTRKTRDAGFYPHLLWMQFGYVALALVAVVHAVFWLPDADLGSRLANIGIVLFFLYMISAIIRAAFFGVQPLLPAWVLRLFGQRSPMAQE